jgi:hypothetical protein
VIRRTGGALRATRLRGVAGYARRIPWPPQTGIRVLGFDTVLAFRAIATGCYGSDTGTSSAHPASDGAE